MNSPFSRTSLLCFSFVSRSFSFTFHSSAETIDEGVFRGVENMTYLDLSHNHLKSIDEEAFDSDTYANHLMVQHNQLTSMSQVRNI